jgi:hypothetical protein
MFDYQKTMVEDIEAYEIIDDVKVPTPWWFKKATGIAGTETSLRKVVHSCVYDDTYRGSLVAIVTGPNIELATEAITRVKDLFEEFIPEHANFDTKQTFVYINGVKIQAFPSHNIRSLRGRPNISHIIADEGDHFPKNSQWELRAVTERYVGKSGAKLMLISTPNAPGGLFEKIEFEEPCMYHRRIILYEYGMNKVYTPAFIKKAMESPDFDREYRGKYLGLEGNVITTQQVDRATSSTIWPDVIDKNPQHYFGKDFATSIGVDPGFGSSPFGITVTKYINGKIVVVHAQEYDKPSHEAMLQEIVFLMNRYKTFRPKVYIDGANAGWIRSLKILLKEYADYHYYTPEKLKRLIFSASGMIAAPIPFNSYGQKMLEHMRLLFEKNKIVIDKQKFPHLITALRTAKISEETGKLDKDKTSYNNVFDAFRLNLLNYRMTSGNIF